MRFRVALLLVSGVLVFWNARAAPFVLDDATAIVNNQTIRRLSLPGVLQPPRDTPVAGRPLVNLTFAMNYAAGGLTPDGYHAVNLAIHLLAALALFGVVRRTLRLPGVAPALGERATDLAWVTALVWMLHPLNTEVVDYVTQRSESLMGLAYLLTFYCAVRAAGDRDEGAVLRDPKGTKVTKGAKGGRRHGDEGAGRRASRWTAAAVGCCAAGMLCKESMVTAPVALALYDRVFLFDSFRAAFARRKGLYLGLGASWLVLAAIMLSPQRTSVGFAAGTSTWVYLLNQARLVPRYLFLSVWPRALVVDYGLPQALTPHDVMVPAATLAGLAVVTLLAAWRAPRLAFGAVLCVLTLAPTSSLVPIATEVGAERRMYLPLAGLVAMAVAGVFLLVRRVPWRARVALAAIVCLLAATGTWLRNREYTDPLVLARRTVERWPSGRGHFILATELMTAGQTNAALDEFRRSAVDYPGGHYALGAELVGDGHLDEGVSHLREFIRLAPRDNAVPAARDLIGRVLMSRGELDAAADEFSRILDQLPTNARAQVFLGDARLQQGRFDDAIRAYQAARASDPAVARDVEVSSRLGAALASAHRLDEAATTLRDAIALEPEAAPLHKVLGQVLAMGGRLAEAADAFRRAVQLAPDDAQARQFLAAAERDAGQPARQP